MSELCFSCEVRQEPEPVIFLFFSGQRRRNRLLLLAQERSFYGDPRHVSRKVSTSRQQYEVFSTTSQSDLNQYIDHQSMIDVDTVGNIIAPQYLLRNARRRVGHRYRDDPKQQRSGHIGHGRCRHYVIKREIGDKPVNPLADNPSRLIGLYPLQKYPAQKQEKMREKRIANQLL